MEWELCSWAQRKEKNTLCTLGLEALSRGFAGEIGHAGPQPSFPSPLAVGGEERCAHHSVYRGEEPEQSLSADLFHLQLFLPYRPRDITWEEQMKEEARRDFCWHWKPCMQGPQDGLRLSQYRGPQVHAGPQSHVMGPF